MQAGETVFTWGDGIFPGRRGDPPHVPRDIAPDSAMDEDMQPSRSGPCILSVIAAHSS
jgi:hypothetical protein